MIKNIILLTTLSCIFALLGCDGSEPMSQKNSDPVTSKAISYQAGDNFIAQRGDTMSSNDEGAQVNIKTNIKAGSSVVTVLSGAVELTKKEN